MRENSSGPPPAPRPHTRPPNSEYAQIPPLPAGPSQQGLPETLQTRMKEWARFAPQMDLLILLQTLTVLELSSFGEVQRVKMR